MLLLSQLSDITTHRLSHVITNVTLLMFSVSMCMLCSLINAKEHKEMQTPYFIHFILSKKCSTLVESIQ